MLRPLGGKNVGFFFRVDSLAHEIRQVNWQRYCARRQLSSRSEALEADHGQSSLEILQGIEEYTTRFPISVFTSASNNPYHNLAIENHILKHSNPESSILFTYVNRPCIVFGRNQNPWLEINIARAHQGLTWNRADWEKDEGLFAEDGKRVPLDLVRRRSGGGTVIHDAGNLNFSFIVPNDKDFTRNKHANLIVTALRSCLQTSLSRPNLEQFRKAAYYSRDEIYVNERHDIAMKVRGQAFKVSGSAFKLTKGRALHHGTLLLASPNIPEKSEIQNEGKQSLFSQLLTSPAKPFLDAKGVGSVSSPVHNLFNIDRLSGDGSVSAARKRLIKAIREAIAASFIAAKIPMKPARPVIVGDEVATSGDSKVVKIQQDVQEMLTDAWRYGQTPSFSYCSSHGEVTVTFQSKQSKISEAEIKATESTAAADKTFSGLDGKLLHDITSWQSHVPTSLQNRHEILERLSSVFPRARTSSVNDSGLDGGNEILQEGEIKCGSDQTSPEILSTIRRSRVQKELEVEKPASNTLEQS